MFQQCLIDLFPPTRIYTGLYPFGRWSDPCRVKCSVCDFDELAADWQTAKRIAGRHDFEHDKQEPPEKAAP